MRNFSIALIMTLFFWALTWVNIENPKTFNFDEFHYIPASIAYLHNHQMQNTEHPPLAKILIAQGISLLGDNPKGWRLMSTIFGSLTLAGLYFWALHLFKSTQSAVLVAILSIGNQVLFVQSRIAMLDTFMAAFLIWAVYYFSRWWHNRNILWPLFVSAILFGLAIATKWFALIPMGVCGLCILYSLVIDKNIKIMKNNYQHKFLIVFGFGAIVVFSYMLAFLPFDFTFQHFIEWQKIMWDRQHMVGGTHPYSSYWWSWPLELRPIWYSYQNYPENNSFSGVLFLGNPLILWGGVLAILYCGWEALAKKCHVAREILLAYLVCLLSWPLIPRKISFFYYYYPAILILSLALIHVLNKRPKLKWIFMLSAVACFIYFLPVLNSSIRSNDSFRSWIWFESWI